MLCHQKNPGDLTYPLSPRFWGVGVRGAIYDVSVFIKSCTKVKPDCAVKAVRLTSVHEMPSPPSTPPGWSPHLNPGYSLDNGAKLG